MCADLVGLLDALDLSSANVVGHDLGGLVAYALAGLHPGRVDRLALLDAPLPLFGLEVPAWNAIQERLWHQRFHRVPFLPEALIAGRERLYLSWHFAQTIQNVGAITSDDLDEYVRCYSQAGGLAASFAFGRAIETSAEQVRAAADETMSIPLLFFGGAKSLAGAFKDHLGQIATDARLLVVPDSGHWMPEENPAFVTKELESFFAR
jgi:pimeloyl-ACP methyl ester carboxylesterase